MALKWFVFVFLVVAIYIIVGNYLHFAKVLKALDEPPSMTPSGQLAQIDRYLQTLDETQKQAWSARVLGHIRAISVVVAVLVLSAFAAPLFSQ